MAERTTTASSSSSSLLLLLLSVVVTAPTASAKPPNIVFIVADDLGWNDIGFHNPDILSPNVDKLAKGGIIFDQAYVQSSCSPSRAAFLSGYYPYRIGLQHIMVRRQQAVCVPANTTLLPQYMKELGYATHMVGKWHLGFCNWNCTPTFRGFDSFLGFYNAMEDYYTRTYYSGYDFRDDETLSVAQNGTYSTFVFQERVREIIYNHDVNTPLFLYLPLQSVHEPLEVPEPYYDMYPNIKDEERRTFSGMVTAMDDVIGNLTSYLTQRDMYNDTLFFFSSDNGGWVSLSGNNYPLRGGKFSLWEGGTRAVSFAHGAGLDKVKGTTFDGLMHAVDWTPTIVAAAGGEVKDKDMDGLSIWEAIKTGGASPRSEFIYNLDDMVFPKEGQAGIRQGDYKLLLGYPGLYSGWYEPDKTTWSEETVQEVQEAMHILYSPEVTGLGPATPENSQGWDDKLRLYNVKVWPQSTSQSGPITLDDPQSWDDNPRLYNLKDDPTEHHDLAERMPDMVEKLKARLAEYKKRYVPPNSPPSDPASDPEKYGGAWTPGWC